MFCGRRHPDELRQNGHTFSETGGDWLVHFYEEHGEKFFAELNGLFSGLLIDRRRRKVFLFNDRYGMERIYWHETPDAFYFASEAKALLRVLPELRTFDPEGAAQFFAFGSTLEGRTLFRGVQTLPGGSLWKFAEGQCAREKYFSPEKWESQPTLAPEEFAAKCSETFSHILPPYFATESNIGIALTGGLDTRMIMASRPPNRHQQTCYTFAGQAGETTLDDKIAARVAEACGLEHQLLRLRPDFFADFAAQADRTVYLTDGTFGVAGAHEIYFNRQARALSACGSPAILAVKCCAALPPSSRSASRSELFDAELTTKLPPPPVSLPRTGTKRIPTRSPASSEIPWHLFGSVAAGRSQVTFRTPFLDSRIVALAYQMPVQLRRSSLHAARFIHANSPVMSAIPTDRGFTDHNSGPLFLARRFFAEVTFKMDYYSNEGLPGPVSAFDPAFKWFAAKTKLAGWHKYLHYSRWFRNELAPYVRQSLADLPAGGENFWSPEFIKQLAEQHISGRKNYSAEINAVLTLAAVNRLLVGRNWESPV